MARAIVRHGDNILLIQRNKYGRHFYSLPGGKIEQGEPADQAALRELMEEASVQASIVRQVYHEEIKQFGISDYFLCKYISGEPRLGQEAPEHVDNQRGDNTYQPMWVKIEELDGIKLLPQGVAERLKADLMNDSWPERVLTVVEEETEDL